MENAWDRLRFEILYFSLKTKGSFSTHNMSQLRRIQRSFQRFQKLAEGEQVPAEMSWTDKRDLVQQCFAGKIDKHDPENYTYRTVASPAVGESLDEVLRYFWGKRKRYPDLDTCPLSFDERREVFIDSCREAMFKYLLNQSDAQGDEQAWAKHLARHLETVRGQTETEVAKRHPTRHLWLFKNPQTISSISALKERTEYFIKNRPWTNLQVIAETGEWLLEATIREALLKHAKKSGVHLHLIVREEAVPLALEANHAIRVRQELESAGSGKIKVKVDELPWWHHNRHMTLLLDGDTPTAGIYFRRRLKTPLIYPVTVEDAYDLGVLKKIFERYVSKVQETQEYRQYERQKQKAQSAEAALVWAREERRDAFEVGSKNEAGK
ncbi:MAG TPA: hypothetical protein VII23_00025 [Terriglobales bacterium]